MSNREAVLDFYLPALKMMQEIKLQDDKTGQSNRLICWFVFLLFYMKSFTEYICPVMTEINVYFCVPNNRLKIFASELPTIYQVCLKDKCVLVMLSNNTKYTPHEPTIALVRGQHIIDVNISEQHMHDSIINAVRLANASISVSSSKNIILIVAIHADSPKRSSIRHLKHYMPHLILVPAVFVAPNIYDKHINESIMQYNLKFV